MDKLMRNLEKNKAQSTRLPSKHLFRASARLVVNNYPWMLDYNLRPLTVAEEAEDKGENNSEKTLSDLSRGTVRYVLEDSEESAASLQPCLTKELSLEEKYVLFKRPDRRSAHEMKGLEEKNFYLRCFLEYPITVRNLLARLLQFVFYKPNITIVREGELGQYIYFMARGTVIRRTSHRLGDALVSPQCFGYKSCFHDVPHTASYETATNCELFVVSKKVLNYVLKVTGYKREWQKIQFALQKFPHKFGFWDGYSLKQSVIQCQLKKFDQHHVIMRGRDDHTYFLVKGTVGMIQLNDEKGNTALQQIYELLPGTCFNIGENLLDKVLIATSNVQCVLIPQQLLLSQPREDDFWYKVKMALSKKMPKEKTSLAHPGETMASKFQVDSTQYNNLQEAAREYRRNFRKYSTDCEFEYDPHGQDVQLPPHFYESFFDEENMNLMLKMTKDQQKEAQRNRHHDHKRFQYSAADSLNSSESSTTSSVSSNISSGPLF